MKSTTMTQKKKIKLFKEPHTVLEHQKDAIRFAVNHKRAIISDPVGTGKTAEALYSFAYMKEHRNKEYKGFIITTANSSYQWGDEIEKFTDYTFFHITSKMNVNERIKYYKENNLPEDFIIINYELLVSDWYTGLREFVKNNEFIFITDEVHYCKNLSTGNHKTFRSLLRMKKNAIAWGLTATPLVNYPEDLYGIVQMYDSTIFKNFKTFKERYCHLKRVYIGSGIYVDTIVGYKNLEELQEKLSNILFIRKLDGLKPALKYHDERIEAPPQLLAMQATIYNTENNFLSRVQALQRLFSEPPEEFAGVVDLKYNKLKKLLKEITAEGGKVLVFSNYLYTINSIVERLEQDLPELNILRFTGQDSQDNRQLAQKLFMTDNDYKVLFVNSAGSNSMNFQAASHIIFIDLPFSYGQYDQTIGRVRRLFSATPVINIINLTYKDSIEEWKLNLLKKKKKLTEKVFGVIDVPLEIPKRPQLKQELKKLIKNKL